MEQKYIRAANEEDLKLITSYFKQALEHYEAQGELIAIQDIKYFISNMDVFSFYLKEHNEEFITYAFEFPETPEAEAGIGELMIPLPNSERMN